MKGVHFEIVGGSLQRHELKNFLSQSYHYDKHNPQSYQGFQIDPSLSGTRVQVYHNPKTKQTVVAHRGTKGTQDILTDMRLFWGDRSNARFKHGMRIQKMAEDKYGKNSVTTIGHSLGASIAETSGQKGKEVITLNKPTTIDRLSVAQGRNQHDIRTRADPVSILKPLQTDQRRTTTINSPGGWFQPLTEHKTDVLERHLADRQYGV